MKERKIREAQQNTSEKVEQLKKDDELNKDISNNTPVEEEPRVPGPGHFFSDEPLYSGKQHGDA